MSSEAESNKIIKPGGRRIGTHNMSEIRTIVAAKQKAKAAAEAAGLSETEVNAAIAAATRRAPPVNADIAAARPQTQPKSEFKSQSKFMALQQLQQEQEQEQEQQQQQQQQQQQRSRTMTTAATAVKTERATTTKTEDKKSIKIRSSESHTSAIADTGRTISDVADNQRREDIPITGQTLLGEGNALSDQTCPHRHVKLKMTYKERVAYRPPRGINVLFYGPRDDEMKLPEGEVHATFYCPVLNPNRDEQKYIDDIDEELARLNRVIQDNITEWHEPKLVKHPKVMIHALIEKLHDDPDLEPHIKNIRDITKTDVTQSAIDEMNAKENIQKYEKLKQSLLKKTDRKTSEGDKISEGTIGVL